MPLGDFDQTSFIAHHSSSKGSAHIFRRACEQTLDQAELLQQRAAAREAYPCQTLLLGLQADLILQQLGSGRSDRALDDLGPIQRGCTGF